MDDPLLYVVASRPEAFRPAGCGGRERASRPEAFRPAGCGGRERHPSGLRPARFGLPGQFAVFICRPSIALGLASSIFMHGAHAPPQRSPIAKMAAELGDPRRDGGRCRGVLAAAVCKRGWPQLSRVDGTAERAISNAATTTRHSRCRTLRARAR
jgi:hypothetical protein